MPLRGDFDVEWDNDAELLLADMEFSEVGAYDDVVVVVVAAVVSALALRERRLMYCEHSGTALSSTFPTHPFLGRLPPPPSHWFSSSLSIRLVYLCLL